jgi:hypothetical protein
MKRWLLLGSLMCLSSIGALASPIMCTNGTFQDYIGLPAGGCQFGNATFSNFVFAYTSSDGTTAASPGKGAASVSVSPETQPTPDSDHPGLQFGTANLTPAIGFFQDYTFTFTVTALPGFNLDDAFLKMTGAFLIGSGSATTVETLTPSTGPQTSLNGFFTDTDTTHKTSTVTYPTTSSLTVTKDIKVTNTSSTLFDLSAVSNDFSLLDGSSVPEPVTAASIGFGLCCLALNLRKRGKKGLVR